MEQLNYSDILNNSKGTPESKPKQAEPPLIPTWNKTTASVAPVPSECVCGGKGLFLATDTNTYKWCICQREGDAHIERCLRNSGLTPSQLHRHTFDTWVPAFNPGLNPIYATVKEYAEGKPRPPWLCMWGSYGTGKTHLTIATIRTLALKGVAVDYYEAHELEDSIKTAIQDNSVRQVIRHASTIPVLAIDDLGTQLNSEFVQSSFHQILNTRFNNKLKTIITMNPEGFRSVPKRLMSRLTDSLVCSLLELRGEDVRPMLRG